MNVPLPFGQGPAGSGAAGGGHEIECDDESLHLARQLQAQYDAEARVAAAASAAAASVRLEQEQHTGREQEMDGSRDPSAQMDSDCGISSFEHDVPGAGAVAHGPPLIPLEYPGAHGSGPQSMGLGPNAGGLVGGGGVWRLGSGPGDAPTRSATTAAATEPPHAPTPRDLSEAAASVASRGSAFVVAGDDVDEESLRFARVLQAQHDDDTSAPVGDVRADLCSADQEQPVGLAGADDRASASFKLAQELQALEDERYAARQARADGPPAAPQADQGVLASLELAKELQAREDELRAAGQPWSEDAPETDSGMLASLKLAKELQAREDERCAREEASAAHFSTGDPRHDDSLALARRLQSEADAGASSHGSSSLRGRFEAAQSRLRQEEAAAVAAPGARASSASRHSAAFGHPPPPPPPPPAPRRPLRPGMLRHGGRPPSFSLFDRAATDAALDVCQPWRRTFDFRSTWDMNSDVIQAAESRLVPLNMDTQEYDTVYSLFCDGGMNLDRGSVSIQRVQNEALWRGHSACTEIIAAKETNRGDSNIVWLWHGARGNEQSILRSGLEPQFGSSLPYGVWVHAQSNYSAGRFCTQLPDGSRSMFLLRVCTGTHGQDDGTGRRPNRVAGFSELADCHVFSMPFTRDGRMVLYRGDQCYPGYRVVWRPPLNNAD